MAKGFPTKLLANDAVKRFIKSHKLEILEQFELVTNTVSVEEALQQPTDGRTVLQREECAEMIG